jgi:D-aspartate ligase
MFASAILLEPHEGCLSVARALRRHRVPVNTIAGAGDAWVGASRGVRGRVLASLDDDPEAWLAELEGLARAGPGVLISGSDRATEFLHEHRERIAPSLRSFERPEGLHLALMHKERCYELALDAGLRVPRTRTITSHSDLERACEEVTFPGVLRAAMRHQLSGERMYSTPVEDRQAVLAAAGPALRDGHTLLLSEVVPGPETALEAAVTVRDEEGRYPLLYGRRKVRQWPPYYGIGTITEVSEVPEAVAMTRRLLDHAGFVGLASVEYKRHSVTGELVLIEANVRVPQSFGAGEAAGIDAGWRLYATLAGLTTPPQPPPRPGRKVVIPYLEARAARAALLRGERPGELLRSWRGIRDVGVLDPRDPLPGLAFLANRVARRLRRPRQARKLGLDA